MKPAIAPGRLRAFTALFLLLALLVVAAGCSSSSTTTTAAQGTTAPPSTASTSPATSATTPAPAPATTAGTSALGANTVTIQNFAFNPPSLTVKVGDKVTWSNQDSTTHTVTADDGSFSSGDLGTGATFSFTFTKAGTFGYHCSIHTNMTAKVIVQ